MTQYWPTFRLKEICDISSSRRIRAHEYTESGVPFYRGKEIIEKHNGALRVSTDLFISEERFSEVCAKNGAPSAGDLLLTSVGTLGIPYVVQPGERFYFKDGNLTWFRNFEGLTSDYLYYWLLSPSGKAELKRCTIGSSQPAFTIVLLKDIEIALPPLPVQRRIASILSAYDDLIENNTRRIEILEEMARRLYEEWFVHFRFPGHEKVSFKESELGEIPEGWRIGRLGDLVENVKISSKAGSQLSEREYVPIDCIARKSLALPEAKPWEDAKSSLVLFEEDDILFGAMRPYFHKVAVAPVPGVTRTTCFVLRARQKEVWAYAALTVFKEETVAHASAHTRGATIPYAVWDDSLEDLTVLIPPAEILQTFDAKVAPMLQWIKGQFKRQRNLRAQRDLLLPKLVSGEIDVSDIPMPDDKEVEAA